MLPVGDSRMEWTLRLVGTGIDGQSRSFEVMAISRSDGLGEIANLGLTLAEGNLLLAQVQQQVAAEQANTHATFRPDCRSSKLHPGTENNGAMSRSRIDRWSSRNCFSLMRSPAQTTPIFRPVSDARNSAQGAASP